MLNKQWQVPQFLFQITLLYGSNELLNVGSSVDERIRNDGYSSVQIEGTMELLLNLGFSHESEAKNQYLHAIFLITTYTMI